MGYTVEEWRERILARADLTGMVTHLTKPADGVDLAGMSESEINVEAASTLIQILVDGVIRGSTTDRGFIVGSTPAVCFQEVPHYGLIQNVEHEAARRRRRPWEKLRYCGAGVCFSKIDVYRAGGRPVLYEKTDLAKQILPQWEHWRIVRFDLADRANLVDWTHEREWRVPKELRFRDLKLIPHIVLYDAESWAYFRRECPEEIFGTLYSVTVLRSIVL